jgi:F0F1-type ATP synthase membrane subunit b/b'
MSLTKYNNKRKNTMSAATREASQQTQKHLQNAEKHLQSAEQSSQQSGDPSLQQTVKRLREDTTKTHTEIGRKLDNKTG